MAFLTMEFVVGSMVLLYVFETYLALRQLAVLKSSTFPVALQSVINPEMFKKSSAYMLEKSYLHLVHEAATILVDCMILLYGLLPWLWKSSGSFLGYIGLDVDNEIIHSLSFLGAILICAQIFELPFSLHSTFVIEARHGFNKQTIWLFFTDFFRGIFIFGLFGAPIAAAAILIMQRGGPYLAVYLWVLSVIASIVLMTVYPLLIAPLFNNVTPLPDGELKNKIEDLASSLKFPLDRIFLGDGSRRSTHSNAYMYGVLNKSIVLDDTLINQSKDMDEVAAIIAHEMGHWKLNHSTYAFVASQVLALLQFGLFDLVRQSSDLYLRFGFDKRPIVVGFFIFQHVVMPAQRLLSFGMNILSRSSEFKADAFAKNLGYGTALRACLVRLQEKNLTAVAVDPWYSAYHYSHPPFAERLAALDELDKKSD